MKVLRHSFESGERRSTFKAAVIVNHLVLECSMSSRRGTERQFKAIPGCNGNFKFHPTDWSGADDDDDFLSSAFLHDK